MPYIFSMPGIPPDHKPYPSLAGLGSSRHFECMTARLLATGLLLFLLTGWATHPCSAESLWVEQASSESFPELTLWLSPWNRATLRLLREKSLRVRVDSKPASLLAVDAVDTPPHVYLLLDRALVDGDRGEAMDKLASRFVEILPEGSRVSAWVLTIGAEPVMTGTRDLTRLSGALTAGPRQGQNAAMRRGLEEALDAIERDASPRPVLLVLSATRDPSLRAGQHTRREVLARVRRLGLHPGAFSLGSGVDRSFLRALGEGSGGVTQHSWSPRNLKDGLRRLSIGLGLTFRVRVQSPFLEEDGSLRLLQVLRPDGDLLTDSRVRYPGIPPSLSPLAALPATSKPAAPPPPPVPVPQRPGAAPPGPSTAPRRRGPGATFAAVPRPPRLALGRWDTEAADEAERNLRLLLDARIQVIPAHADAGLHRALRGIELALENRDAALARRLYRHARLSLAFLGSTYGRTMAATEDSIDRHEETGAPKAMPQGERLRAELREKQERWKKFKVDLLAWGDHLAALPDAR